MTTVTILNGAITVAYEPFMRAIPSGARGETQGWSSQVVGRLRHWLSSIDGEHLQGVGYAFTLTLKSLPTEPAWAAMRKRLMDNLRDRGAIRVHWVTEWQQRGVPHLHGVAYFPDDCPAVRIDSQGKRKTFYRGKWLVARSATSAAWWGGNRWEDEILWMWLIGCKAGQRYGAQSVGQHIETIRQIGGWLIYLAKHAGRGVYHYQRSGKPHGWDKTGRMWGKGGDWPLVAPLKIYGLDPTGEKPKVKIKMRRLIGAYTVSEARRRLRSAQTPRQVAGAVRLLRAARGARKHPYKREPFGTFSYVPSDLSWRFIGLSVERVVEVLDTGTGEIMEIHPIGIEVERL